MARARNGAATGSPPCEKCAAHGRPPGGDRGAWRVTVPTDGAQQGLGRGVCGLDHHAPTTRRRKTRRGAGTPLVPAQRPAPQPGLDSAAEDTRHGLHTRQRGCGRQLWATTASPNRASDQVASALLHTTLGVSINRRSHAERQDFADPCLNRHLVGTIV